MKRDNYFIETSSRTKTLYTGFPKNEAMLIIGCSHGLHLAQKVAKKAKAAYSPLFVNKFPDGELYARFQASLKGKDVVLVQSFYGEINDALVEVVFAAKTAKELGAKKVSLAAPYFPYLRQDKRFKPGEAISSHIVGKLLSNYLDEIYIMDPHLHRDKTLDHIFHIKSHRLSADPLIAQYIKKKIPNPVIIGPDWESYKWAKKTALMIGVDYTILEKTRYSSRHVDVKFTQPIHLKGKTAVIVDDIVSSGHTLLETIKDLHKLKARKIVCICVHGIFAENALQKLWRAGSKVVSCNTIPNKATGIDVSGILADALKK